MIAGTDQAIEELTEQIAVVAKKHITCAPHHHVDEPEACLVQRNPGRGVLTLGLLALRALAWVMAEERRVVIREGTEYAASLGSINDAELTQDDALWFLSRAQTLLEKLRDGSNSQDGSGA